MSFNQVLLFAIIVIMSILVYNKDLCSLSCKNITLFDQKDENEAIKAAKKLETKLNNGDVIPEISDEQLELVSEKIYLVKTKNHKLSDNKENFAMYSPVNNVYNNSLLGFPNNAKYWPQNYYSYYYPAGVWPPGLYNRLYWWSPGFYTTSGWKWALRPGVKYVKWPYTSWARNNNSYYYINNQGIHNKMQDASGY